MAIPADTAWEVQTTGNDANGGGFSDANKGATGVDHTYGGSAAVTSYTTLSGSGTTTLSCSGGDSFSNTQLGNIINISGQGLYCITAYGSSTSVTVDRNLGTFSGASGKEGGAFLTPGYACAQMVAGNAMHVKSGTYTITSASTNIAGGCLSLPAGTNTAQALVVGYQTARHDYGTKPLLQLNAGVSSATILTMGNGGLIANLSLDGATQTSSRGGTTTSGNNTGFFKCHFANFTNSALYTATATACTATTCSSNNVFRLCTVFFCEAYANTITGFDVYNNNAAICCISSANTGASTDGFVFTGFQSLAANCVSYSNGRDGFRCNTSYGGVLINCVAEANSGYGFKGTTKSTYLLNCAAYNNTSGKYSSSEWDANLIIGFQDVTAGSVFTNAGSGDFSLNNTASRGALLRAAGYPATFPRGTTSSYRDIGVAQHQDPAGGGVGPSPSILIGGGAVRILGA